MHWIIKEYLSLSIREKRSFLVVAIFLFASILLRVWLCVREPDPIEFSYSQKVAMEEFIASLEQIPDFEKENRTFLPVPTKYDPVNFDPNTIKKDELRSMGINGHVAENIIKYRKAGGIFRSKEDLKTIYGMDSSLFAIIEPFIIFSESEFSQKNDFIEPVNEEPVHDITDFNTAGFKDLVKINGIEPGIAGRIVKYRDLLGGYTGFDQLKEVYGISDSVRLLLEEHFTIDTGKIKKISLEMTDFSELLRHPYLEKDHVKEIWKLKDFYGDSISPDHIIENKILPDSILVRILPYLMK